MVNLDRKQPGLWRNGWILNQDNVPSHNALSVMQFLTSKNISGRAYPLYLPELAPCNFFLFPNIKSALKGTHFLLVEEVKAKMTQRLNILTENDLHHCFEQWQHHMQLCLNSEWDYSEGNHK
ncbi:hypothetical protein Cfor_09438 [Coptotermes formosanus]|uniref:Tc1-like transposase DDE domain-containing protein n=1 Tax=Coptotermes formosanus TaxID=36987 RepID=A0A6L2PWW7_COPFO|nr:hypothetical protein Cfor_09438 [Coptotermes formosanus]